LKKMDLEEVPIRGARESNAASMIQGPMTLRSQAPPMLRGPLTRRYAPTSPRKRGEVNPPALPREKQSREHVSVPTLGKCKKLDRIKRLPCDISKTGGQRLNIRSPLRG
jgi:hypothetical protein